MDDLKNVENVKDEFDIYDFRDVFTKELVDVYDRRQQNRLARTFRPFIINDKKEELRKFLSRIVKTETPNALSQQDKDFIVDLFSPYLDRKNTINITRVKEKNELKPLWNIQQGYNEYRIIEDEGFFIFYEPYDQENYEDLKVDYYEAYYLPCNEKLKNFLSVEKDKIFSLEDIGFEAFAKLFSLDRLQDKIKELSGVFFLQEVVPNREWNLWEQSPENSGYSLFQANFKNNKLWNGFFQGQKLEKVLLSEKDTEKIQGLFANYSIPLSSSLVKILKDESTCWLIDSSYTKGYCLKKITKQEGEKIEVYSLEENKIIQDKEGFILQLEWPLTLDVSKELSYHEYDQSEKKLSNAIKSFFAQKTGEIIDVTPCEWELREGDKEKKNLSTVVIRGSKKVLDRLFHIWGKEPKETKKIEPAENQEIEPAENQEIEPAENQEVEALLGNVWIEEKKEKKNEESKVSDVSSKIGILQKFQSFLKKKKQEKEAANIHNNLQNLEIRRWTGLRTIDGAEARKFYIKRIEKKVVFFHYRKPTTRKNLAGLALSGGGAQC
ncbi:MAG: hypothetical protein HUU50_11595 [Candidatus Brocadiae bacterium]|nr:hypothetical protein [Candidatus Brocadiia bacterium]